MYVIDASIFASVIVKDEFYDKAREIIKEHRKNGLITVDIIYVEVANVLWKHVFAFKRIPVETFSKLKEIILPLIQNTVSKVYDSKDLIIRALDNAVKYGITVYDSLYVTLALETNSKLLTFDEELKKKLARLELNIL